MRDRAIPDVRDDLHVAMRMWREAALGTDGIVVPDADAAPAHAPRIVVVCEGEVVVRVKPAVVRVAEAAEWANVDHSTKMGAAPSASSVTHVTVFSDYGNRPDHQVTESMSKFPAT